MSKKNKNILDFDSLLSSVHLPQSKTSFSDAMDEALEEFVPTKKSEVKKSEFQKLNNRKEVNPRQDNRKSMNTKGRKQENMNCDAHSALSEEHLFDQNNTQQNQLKQDKAQKDKKQKEKTVPHYHGHRDRLRERVLSHIHTVESYELLELLLGYVHVRKDTKPMAKALLHKFGSLWGVLNAHPAEISNIPDLGPSSKIFFTLLRELVARYFVEPVKAKKSVSIAEIVVMARCMMDGLPHEEIWVALLDNNNRLLAFEQVNSGLSESVSCSARTLTEIALFKKASAIILIHNHPGGKAVPSLSDIETTKYLHNVLRHMGIRLLEHLILADGQVISFMNNHLLQQEESKSFFSSDGDGVI